MAIRQLLLDHGHLLPKEMRPHVVALVRQYDVWLGLWDALAEAESSAPEQVFVFENPVRFSRRAQRALTDLHERLQG